MNNEIPEPSRGSLFLTVIGVAALFLLFAAVLYFSYLPRRETRDRTPAFSAAQLEELNQLAPAEREVRLQELRWERKLPTPEDRRARLQELREQQAAALENYSWADRDNGVVRLPIQRAIDLVVQEHAKDASR